jgi:hypothetical protein
MTTYKQVIKHLINCQYTNSEFIKWINAENKGYRQEAISIITAYCGLCENLSNYKCYQSNGFDDGELVPITSLKQYFTKEIINKGNSKCDMLLVDYNNNMIVFSSKNIEGNNLGNYDIAEIIALHKKHWSKYNLKIGIISKDTKDVFLKKLSKTRSNKYLKDYEYIIIDQNELYRKWQLLNTQLTNFNDIDEVCFKIKNKIKLRFNQKIICKQIKNKMLELWNTKNWILLNGSECRTGKSYCMALDILNFTKIYEEKFPNKQCHILFLTSQPSTIQTIEELFMIYDEFNIFKINNCKDFVPKSTVKIPKSDTEDNKSDSEDDIQKHIISLISIHKIRIYTKKQLPINDVNLIITDEFHEAGNTELTAQVFHTYKLNNIPKIFYTATPEKPRLYYKIPNENIFKWTSNDNILMSCYNVDNKKLLLNNHNLSESEFDKILSKFDIEDTKNLYSKFPSFYNLIIHPTKQCIKEFQTINSFEGQEHHGFSFESVLMLNKKKFQSENSVKSLLYYIFGQTKKINGSSKYAEDGIPGVIETYESICDNIGQRICFDGEQKRPLIIHLVLGSIKVHGLNKKESKDESNINIASKLLINLFNTMDEKSLNIKPSEIVFIPYNAKNQKILKRSIETIEHAFDRHVKKYKYPETKYIVLVLGESLHTGITNKYCDLIILLSQIKSYDRWYQTIHRAKNEVNCVGDGNKKHAFIVYPNFQGCGSISNLIETYRNKSESIQDTEIRVLHKQRLINILEIDLNEEPDVQMSESTEQQITVLYNNIKQTINKSEKFRNYIQEMNIKQFIISNNNFVNIYKSLNIKPATQKILATLADANPNAIKQGIEIIMEKIQSEKKTKETDESNADFITRKLQEAIHHCINYIVLILQNWESDSIEDIIKYIKNTEVLDTEPKTTIYDLILQCVDISFPVFKNQNCKIDEKEIKMNKLFVTMIFTFISQDFYKDEIIIYIIDKVSEKNKIYAEKNIRANHIATNKIVMITNDERQSNAEFPTPLWLIDEMASKIPDKFWSSDKTILDPCVGKCPFPVVMYEKLMDGLKDKYPDEEVRRKHILEDLLYFADINPLNVYISKFILDPFGEYKLNYFIGDALKLTFDRKFDLVIGNPPYNGTGGTGTGNTIWQEFVKKALNTWLGERGYLVYVHPSGWRKPCYNKSQLKQLFSLMTHNNQMLYLEIHGTKDGMKTFNAGTRYDWYVIQKADKKIDTCVEKMKNKKTKVKDEEGVACVINMSKFEWLPNSNIKYISQMIVHSSNTEITTCPIIMNSSYHATRQYVSHKETELFKYPCIHSTNKSGIRYMYSSRNDNGHFKIPKIIFGESGINDVVIDMDGKYGMTQGAMAIQVENLKEAENIKKTLLSDKFKIVIKATMFGNFRIDWNIFKSFRKDFWMDFL